MKIGIGLILIMLAGCAGQLAENKTEDVVNRPGRDQALVIQLLPNGCVDEVLAPADDNCRDPGEAMRAGCGMSRDCVCAARGKTISWQVALSPSTIPPGGGSPNLPDFSIHFPDGNSPFRRNCVLEAAAGGTIRCVVDRSASDDYKYDIKVSSCNEVYDPRIVIRNFLN